MLVRLVLLPIKALSSDGGARAVRPSRLGGRRPAAPVAPAVAPVVVAGAVADHAVGPPGSKRDAHCIWNVGLNGEAEGDPIVPSRVGLAEQVKDRVVQALVDVADVVLVLDGSWHVPVRVPTEAAQHLSNTVGSKTWVPGEGADHVVHRAVPIGVQHAFEVVANVG